MTNSDATQLKRCYNLKSLTGLKVFLPDTRKSSSTHKTKRKIMGISVKSLSIREEENTKHASFSRIFLRGKK